MLIRAENLNKSYGHLKVLHDVSLQVKQGEIVAIVGPSGAGKSTLLHILGSLDAPDSGKVFVNNEEVFRLREKQLAIFRNKHIGFVFQFHHLLPEFSALENVCLAAMLGGVNKTNAEPHAIALLQKLGLSNRMHHKPAELSGGEQQRVAVARALMNNPAVVLADEPSGNLDSDNARALHTLFAELREQLQKTFVIVTHNPELAATADRVITMRDGRIVSD